MEFTPAEIVEMATLCMSHLDQYSASRIELIGESAALQILPGGPWNLCFHLEKPSIMGIEGVVGTEDSNGYGLVKFSTKYPKVESLGLLDHQGSLPLRDSEAGNFVRRFSFYLFKVQEALHWMLRDLPLLESLKVGMWNSEAISKFLCALPEPPYVSIGKGTHSFNISGLVDANPIRVESCIHGDSLDREKAVAEHRKEVEGTKIALHRLIVAVEGMVKLQPATKTPPDRAHPDGLGDDGTLWHDGRFCDASLQAEITTIVGADADCDSRDSDWRLAIAVLCDAQHHFGTGIDHFGAHCVLYWFCGHRGAFALIRDG